MKANRFLLLLCMLGGLGRLSAQVFPEEGRSLNYRVVGFAPFKGRAVHPYSIQIAEGDLNTSDEFSKKVINTTHCSSPRAIIEVPSFGTNYTWRTVTKQGTNSVYGELHHFSTSSAPVVDSAQYRFRILAQAAPGYKNDHIYLDGSTALYDMHGKPVWFLPERLLANVQRVRDLKITSRGTITFLANDNAYEVDYDGNLIWKTPDSKEPVNNIPGMVERFHHEFTRLSNGHYMVLGNEYIPIPAHAGEVATGPDGKSFSPKLALGTVEEYDSHGSLVWKWSSSKYMHESDLVNYKSAFGDGIADLHENAFFFDEKDKAVYVSFKGINRVVKVRYPGGQVIGTYGDIYGPEGKIMKDRLFTGQHACRYSRIGCLFLFNNNSGKTDAGLPKVKMFREMNDEHGKLQKIWEYECTAENNGPKDFPTGGNVEELPDHSMFVCMGSSYSKVFIVGMDKHIRFSALPETWNKNMQEWQPLPQYRASIVSGQKTFEKLVWSRDITAGVERKNNVVSR